MESGEEAMVGVSIRNFRAAVFPLMSEAEMKRIQSSPSIAASGMMRRSMVYERKVRLVVVVLGAVEKDVEEEEVVVAGEDGVEEGSEREERYLFISGFFLAAMSKRRARTSAI